MRRSLFWFFAVLGFAAYFFLSSDKGGQSQDFRDVNFAVEDTGKVDKIEFIKKVFGETEEKLLLTQTRSGNWKVNQQKPAFQTHINDLLQTLQVLQMREVLIDKGIKAGLDLLEQQHIEINIYDGRRKVKSLLLGREGKDSQGSLMMIKGRDQPYIVEVPGFRGYLNARFNMDTEYWIEKPFIPANMNMLSHLEVRIGLDNSSVGFIDTKSDSSWKIAHVRGLFQNADQEDLQSHIRSFNRKLYALRNFPVERSEQAFFENHLETWNLVLTDGEIQTFSIYEMKDDRERYYVKDGKGNRLIFQQFVLDPYLLSNKMEVAVSRSESI